MICIKDIFMIGLGKFFLIEFGWLVGKRLRKIILGFFTRLVLICDSDS